MKVLVLGGGLQGLSTAYNLAIKGVNVTLFEAKRIGIGSSSRNMGRLRVHFYNRNNVRFGKAAREEMKKLMKDLDLNIMFYQPGYLWLIGNEETQLRFRKINRMWIEEGEGVKEIDSSELKEMFPYISGNYLGAFFAKSDGSFHHDFLVYGLLRALKEQGGKVQIKEINKLIINKNEVEGVLTEKEIVKANQIVVCLGAWTGEFLKGNNIDLPIRPVKKEIAVSEPFKYMIEPLIIDTTTGTYFSQTLKGELIGAMNDERGGFLPININSINWLKEFHKTVTKVIEFFRNIRIMRAWSGYYEMTPDHSHVIGRDEEWPEGLYVNAGYSGHGAMFSPLSGKIMAKMVASGLVEEITKPFSPSRFRKRELVMEELVI